MTELGLRVIVTLRVSISLVNGIPLALHSSFICELSNIHNDILSMLALWLGSGLALNKYRFK